METMASSPPFVLGVDGGGSRTIALVLDGQGREIGRGQGGPSNHQSVGIDAAREGLEEAITTALRAAGHPALAAACLGMAGLDRPEDQHILEEMAGVVLPEVSAEVVHDATIALVGGTGGKRVGVVVIAGTGSIAVGYDASGRMARAGGWGHLLGDEGSGYDLARRALIAATRAHDGRGPATTLTHRLPAAAGVDTLEALANRVYLEGWTTPRLAWLAPVVFSAAEAGDAVASQIVSEAAAELGLAAVAVIRTLGLEAQDVEVVLAGGVFQGGPMLTEGVGQVIHRTAPRAAVHLAEREAVWGAAWMALDKARAASRATP